MTKREKLALITALMLVCGAPAATAQSYGATGPARADTTDPNSAPARARQAGFTSGSEAYARGDRRTTRAAARRGAAPQAAPQVDNKALEAQRNTALLMAHAMAPWAATTPAPATPGKKGRRR